MARLTYHKKKASRKVACQGMVLTKKGRLWEQMGGGGGGGGGVRIHSGFMHRWKDG